MLMTATWQNALSFFKATAAIVTGDELAAGLLNGLLTMEFQYQNIFEIIAGDDLRKSHAILDCSTNYRTYDLRD